VGCEEKVRAHVLQQRLWTEAGPAADERRALALRLGRQRRVRRAGRPVGAGLELFRLVRHPVGEDHADLFVQKDVAGLGGEEAQVDGVAQTRALASRRAALQLHIPQGRRRRKKKKKGRKGKIKEKKGREERSFFEMATVCLGFR
jgi:hypothetical protein